LILLLQNPSDNSNNEKEIKKNPIRQQKENRKEDV
jgi:hypothetical protein